VAAPRPLLAEELAERFPNPEARREFIDQALGLSQQALEAGFALKKLADRYTPQEMELLGAGGRQAAGLLIDAHLDNLDRAWTALVSHLRPLDVNTDRRQAPTGSAGWRRSADGLAAELSGAHKLLVQSLSGGGALTPDAAKLQLGAAFAAVPLEVRQVRHQLSDDLSNRSSLTSKE
jgi:hypothetical protein